MGYNSTIISKKRQLDCGCFGYAFSKNKCKFHSTIDSVHKRISQHDIEEANLSELIDAADDVVSRYVRKIASDEFGNAPCYTCGQEMAISDLQAGHYVSRNCMLFRFDYARNIRPQCHYCNVTKKGNLAIFGQKLEEEHKGITEILYTESQIVYHYTRDELRSLISELNIKIKQLK